MSRCPIRKRGKTYTYTLEMGQQAARYCSSCNQRQWMEQKPLSACPKCGGKFGSAVEERRQVTKGGYRTVRECQRAYDLANSALREGTFVAPSKKTVGEFLKLEWLPSVEKTLAPSTFAGYSGLVDRYISSGVGRTLLTRLSAVQVNTWYHSLLREGRTKLREGESKDDGPKGLSAATVERVHAVMRRSMKDAHRWGYLPSNPIVGVDKPRDTSERKKRASWSGAQVYGFLDSVRSDRLYAMWRLLATTGMRKSEMLGLQWGDLDLDDELCSISRTRVPVGGKVVVGKPKTSRSRRRIPLDRETVEAIREYRRPLLEKSVADGESWDLDAWVFTHKSGSPLDPSKVYRLFIKASMLGCQGYVYMGSGTLWRLSDW